MCDVAAGVCVMCLQDADCAPQGDDLVCVDTRCVEESTGDPASRPADSADRPPGEANTEPGQRPESDQRDGPDDVSEQRQPPMDETGEQTTGSFETIHKTTSVLNLTLFGIAVYLYLIYFFLS